MKRAQLEAMYRECVRQRDAALTEVSTLRANAVTVNAMDHQRAQALRAKVATLQSINSRLLDISLDVRSIVADQSVSAAVRVGMKHIDAQLSACRSDINAGGDA